MSITDALLMALFVWPPTWGMAYAAYRWTGIKDRSEWWIALFSFIGFVAGMAAWLSFIWGNYQ